MLALLLCPWTEVREGGGRRETGCIILETREPSPSDEKGIRGEREREERKGNVKGGEKEEGKGVEGGIERGERGKEGT